MQSICYSPSRHFSVSAGPLYVQVHQICYCQKIKKKKHFNSLVWATRTQSAACLGLSHCANQQICLCLVFLVSSPQEDFVDCRTSDKILWGACESTGEREELCGDTEHFNTCSWLSMWCSFVLELLMSQDNYGACKAVQGKLWERPFVQMCSDLRIIRAS